MATRSRRRSSGYSLTVEEFGPFVGVVDSDDPLGADWKRYLNDARNVIIRPGNTGFETRPGFGTVLGAQAGTCRGIYQFAKKDGTQYPVGFFDDVGAGKVRCIRLDTGADVTHTGFNLATGGGTIFAVAFNDVMICNDGAHTPFYWDANGGAATVIAFNVGSGVAYGAPWVYLAKLFFIRADARGQFVWSEELDQTTGYQQVNYANFWNFQQSSNAPLCAGIGTNDAMFIFRAGSIAMITGAVTANFSTTGTFDGVSDHIGCPVASAIVRVAQTVYFLDRYGRLHRLGPDPNVTAMYDPATQTCAAFSAGLGDGTTAANALPPVQLAYLPSLDVLVHQQPASSYPSLTIMAWRRDTGDYYGIWTDGGTEAFNRGMISTSTSQGFGALGVANSASGTTELVLWRTDTSFRVDRLNGNGSLTSYVHADRTGRVVAVTKTGPLLYSPTVEKIFESIDTQLEVGTDFTGGIGAVLWTQNQTSSQNPSAVSTPGMINLAASVSVRTHTKIREGLKARGRWFAYLMMSGYQTQDGLVNAGIKWLNLKVAYSVSGETVWNEYSVGVLS